MQDFEKLFSCSPSLPLKAARPSAYFCLIISRSSARIAVASDAEIEVSPIVGCASSSDDSLLNSAIVSSIMIRLSSLAHSDDQTVHYLFLAILPPCYSVLWHQKR